MHGKYYTYSIGKQVGFCLAVALTLGGFSTARADFRDDVDYTKLKNEYGTSLPNGSGVRVLQVEYLRNGYWAPQASGELASKTFSYQTDIYGGYSSHANEVGTFL